MSELTRESYLRLTAAQVRDQLRRGLLDPGVVQAFEETRARGPRLGVLEALASVAPPQATGPPGEGEVELPEVSVPDVPGPEPEEPPPDLAGPPGRDSPAGRQPQPSGGAPAPPPADPTQQRSKEMPNVQMIALGMVETKGLVGSIEAATPW